MTTQPNPISENLGGHYQMEMLPELEAQLETLTIDVDSLQ